jgi:hypothetical protein
VVKQIVIGLTLIFFFASFSLGALEEISANFDADAQTSFWTFGHDFSSENAPGRRSLKRSQRGKSSLKSLAAADKPTRVISVIVPIREPWSFFPFSKSSVYKKLSVYRI